MDFTKETLGLWSKIFLTTCLLQAASPQQVDENCPRYCSCFRTTNGVSVNCNYQRLSDLHSLVFPPDTFYLEFSFNALAEINSNTVPNLPGLRFLKIEECQVGSVGADSFSHLPKLQNLTLNGNQIQDIHKDAFRGLTNLRHLLLERNIIRNLEDGVFDSLQLESLYLTNNNVHQLSAGTFSGLVVSDLSLGGNSLSSLTSEMLQPVKTVLTEFTLDNNKLPLEIDIDTFSNTNLRELNLRNSSLTNHEFLKNVAAESLNIGQNQFQNLDLSPYAGLASVRFLNLADVGIEFLDDETLSPFSGVTQLDLSNNRISVLGGSVFRHVPNLLELDLMGNPIMQLSASFGEHLTKLRKLGMRGCSLSDFTNPSPFLPMISLQELDLGNNRIQVIGSQMEPVLNRLTALILDGNQFRCNCEILYIYDWIIRSHQQLKFVVRGLDLCSSPGNVYLWGVPREEFACLAPTITHIIGGTEMGGHANGNAQVLDVAPGSTIMLQCTGHGDPAPELQWSFPFGSHDQVVVEPNINRTVLITTSHYELKQIRLDQAGQYKCQASNIQGQTEAYIQVNVRADMTLPHIPSPPTRPPSTPPTTPPLPTTQSPEQKSTTPKSGSNQGKSENQVAGSGGSNHNVKYTVVGVGLGILLITLIVLAAVIIYVYKARQRAYQRTYAVQERLGELNYPSVGGMNNTDVANGHTAIERMDSEMSTKSTAPFGLSHA